MLYNLGLLQKLAVEIFNIQAATLRSLQLLKDIVEDIEKGLDKEE